MKFRIAMGCAVGGIALALAYFAYGHVQAAHVAQDFERAVHNEDYAAADAMVCSSNNTELAKMAKHAPDMRVNFTYLAQPIADRLLGKQKGRIDINVTHDTSAEAYEIEFVASASGVEVTRYTVGRGDFPSWGETIVAWLPAAW